MSTGTAVAVEFKTVQLYQLQESKTNPRQHFAKDALSDLIASVKEKGVLVPLLVRPTWKPNEAQQHVGAETSYEILAGARRYRAAKAAGLNSLPVLIRHLDDTQALEVQVIENLQRADVHPLEEAEGYKQLLEKGKYEIAALAAKVGKSESYIYQRLKLAELVPAAKKAFYEEKISAGHAILLARLQPQDQVEALQESYYGNDSVCSVREMQSWIHEHIHLELKNVPWTLDDTALVAAAGSCVKCVKRTGANPQLFPDVKAKDTCTDPACFDHKMTASFVQISARLEKAGKRVVQISMSYSPKAKSGVLGESDWRLAETNQECKGLAIGLVVEGGWHKKEYRRGAQLRVCTDKKCSIHWKSSSEFTSSGRSPEDKKKDRARRRELQRRGMIFRALVENEYPFAKTEERRAAVRWVIESIDHDHVKPIVEAMGWTPKKASYGGKDYTETVMEHVEKLPIEQAERWIRYAVVAVEDLWFGAYCSSIPKSRLLLQAAKTGKVKLAEIDKVVAAKWNKKKTKPVKAQTSAKKPAKAQAA